MTESENIEMEEIDEVERGGKARSRMKGPYQWPCTHDHCEGLKRQDISFAEVKLCSGNERWGAADVWVRSGGGGGGGDSS
ncbi:hypothetical protein Pyn_40188 [Prunus yedoensis var. nudiflora]|uniref:Uncharacterized protein n=1 Tax=Prunus yedoensis var. nudiflora TaxID=2094558 RepID=A0A314YUA9_PRUYE|nr:hypothetical protein Pyn_40188 [Prunus yedoensis var. nudiflora]